MKNGLPYSLDLRMRVMKARDENKWTQKQTAEFFDIGLTTVKDWCRLLRKTGSLEPLPRGPGNVSRIDTEGLEKLRVWIAKKPDLTIKELCERFSKGIIPVSTSAISRALKRLNLSYKKKHYRPVKKKKLR